MPNQATQKKTAGASASAALIPFIRAAHKLTFPGKQFTSAVLGADSQDFGPYDAPSGGFLRSILLEVTAPNGVNGAAVIAAEPDAPWNVLKSVELADVNGRAIVYPNITGYDLYLINRYGSYHYHNVPEEYDDFADIVDGAGEDGGFKLLLRIPVEIDATDGYGALPNLNAAEPYRTRYTIAKEADIFGAAPPDTTLPVVNLKEWHENWSLPAEKDSVGNGQHTTPPDLNTTQNWSKTVVPVTLGANTLQLKRTGNLLRNLILIYRDASNDRVLNVTGDYPDDLTITWDRYQLMKEPAAVRRTKMSEHFGNIAAPDGVFVYDFTEDGSAPGAEKRNLWIPTLQPTEILFEGTFGAAGTLEIITNDVMPHGGR